MDRDSLAALMKLLAAAYPGEAMREDTAALWMEMLSDLSEQDLIAAAREHITNSPRFPVIADLRNRVSAINAERALNAVRERRKQRGTL